MSELTSIIFISCFGLYLIGNIVNHCGRIYFDNQLSMVLTKLETIHEKLIRLNVVGPMKIKMNNYFIIGIIAHVIAPIVWMIFQTGFDVENMIIISI